MGDMCDAAEMAEVSKKKKYKKKHTCSPNNVVERCFGSFYVSDVMLGSGRSTESGGDVGDAVEVAELSKKKKYKKKHTWSPSNVVRRRLGSFYVSYVMLGSGR